VLPGGLAGSEKVFAFLAREVSPDVQVSLMAQYFPASRALENQELNRRITPEEYESAKEQMLAAGLTNCFIQDL
jgi:putative pyruvate formate lyase activating enzyme